MSDYKIEKGVPMPALAANGRVHMYPFRQMEVGDSVLFLPRDGEGVQVLRVRLSGSFNREKARKFSAHREGEGLRVWRVA